MGGLASESSSNASRSSSHFEVDLSLPPMPPARPIDRANSILPDSLHLELAAVASRAIPLSQPLARGLHKPGYRWRVDLGAKIYSVGGGSILDQSRLVYEQHVRNGMIGLTIFIYCMDAAPGIE